MHSTRNLFLQYGHVKMMAITEELLQTTAAVCQMQMELTRQ